MIRRPMMRLRRAAARRQKLRCHYCEAQMWLTDPAPFMSRFDVDAAQAARFQCTAEHLVPRREDGPNAKGNVVAACRFCNVQRHDETLARPLDPVAYKTMVRQRMSEGSWHPAWARDKGITSP